MSWILAMQIKDGNHWECTVYEYNSKAKAEAVARLAGLSGYYKIYHLPELYISRYEVTE